MQEETMFTELTYRALLEMLNEHGWKYREAEDRTIICLTQGDDLPIPITFRVDDERKLLTVVSPIPVAVPEAKRTDMAVAVSLANYIIVDGSFDFDFLEGTMLFRLTSSFRESLIGKELLEYMLMRR